MYWKAPVDRVVISVDPKPTQTAGGIALPEKTKGPRGERGIVLAAGPDAKNVEIGDVAWFDSVCATVIEGPGVEGKVVSVQADSVLAIAREL